VNLRTRFARLISRIRGPQLAEVSARSMELRSASVGDVPVTSLRPPRVINARLITAPRHLPITTLSEPSQATVVVLELTIVNQQALNALPPPEIEILPLESWQTPITEDLLPLLSSARVRGRVYDDEVEPEQMDIADLMEDPDGRCPHGMIRKQCEICRERARKKRDARRLTIDPFELVRPILEPPLGYDFDNPLALPEGCSLYPFQTEGVRFLASTGRALLADDQGTGKTVQAIMAARVLVRTGKALRTLVLCPVSVVANWVRELRKWAPELRVRRCHGPKEERSVAWNSPAHAYVTTYSTWWRDIEAGLADPDLFDLYIADECQKIKNPTANRTEAVRRLPAESRWGLSGTPLENRTEEIISIFQTLRPGIVTYRDAERPRALRRKIKPYILRRRKEEVLKDLPAKLQYDRWIGLRPEQRRAYDEVERTGVLQLREKGEAITVQHIFALMNQLKQICNFHPERDISAKAEYVSDQLESIVARGDKVLVFTQYVENGVTRLQRVLRDLDPLTYYGSMSPARRERAVRLFQEDERYPVLLVSVLAGGTGLTLTAANYVFHFDHWWNPATQRQAEDRVHRIGQEKQVFVERLLTEGTIEERIYNILERKKRLFDEVVDALSTDIESVLTEEELFEIFDLPVPSKVRR